MAARLSTSWFARQGEAPVGDAGLGEAGEDRELVLILGDFGSCVFLCFRESCLSWARSGQRKELTRVREIALRCTPWYSAVLSPDILFFALRCISMRSDAVIFC